MQRRVKTSAIASWVDIFARKRLWLSDVRGGIGVATAKSLVNATELLVLARVESKPTTSTTAAVARIGVTADFATAATGTAVGGYAAVACHVLRRDPNRAARASTDTKAVSGVIGVGTENTVMVEPRANHNSLGTAAAAANV